MKDQQSQSHQDRTINHVRTRRETIMDGVFHRMVCWRAQGAREPEYERSHTPLGVVQAPQAERVGSGISQSGASGFVELPGVEIRESGTE